MRTYCLSFCDTCINKTQKVDGWKPACKAYPQGIPTEVAFPDSKDKLKDCGNGYYYIEKK